MHIFIKLLLLPLVALPLFAEPFYHAFGKKVILKPLHENRSEKGETIRWYLAPSGQRLGVKNEVIIGCNDESTCKSVLAAYPVTKTEKLSDTLYLLTLKKESDPFEIADRLYQEPCITLAHPNFIKKRQRR
jgi:hypothetical protein